MAVKSGGGSGTKGGKVLNRLQDLSDITASGNQIIWQDVKGIVSSRVSGDYKRVTSILYNPSTGQLLIEYIA